MGEMIGKRVIVLIMATAVLSCTAGYLNFYVSM